MPYTIDDLKVCCHSDGVRFDMFRVRDRKVMVQFRKNSQFELVITAVDKSIIRYMPTELRAYPVEQMLAGAVLEALEKSEAQ